MKRLLAVFGFLALAAPGLAQNRIVDENGSTLHVFRPKDFSLLAPNPLPNARGNNLINHGGPTIKNAKVSLIFWGPSFASGGVGQTPGPIANELLAMVGQFGTTPEYNTITQYSGIQQSALGAAYWIDPSNPPHTSVTDTDLHNEVNNYINTVLGGAIDTSTVYEVFLPSGYYSTSGGSTSCGGPNLQYCAYHSHFSSGGKDVKYGSMPYPSCSGCQWTGWTTQENFEHFICHETREAVTDEDLNAWYDRTGAEADDKCAWSPSPFLGTGGYGYQYEWSNADKKCVKTK
jgi:hypothetical protein